MGLFGHLLWFVVCPMCSACKHLVNIGTHSLFDVFILCTCIHVCQIYSIIIMYFSNTNSVAMGNISFDIFCTNTNHDYTGCSRQETT